MPFARPFAALLLATACLAASPPPTPPASAAPASAPPSSAPVPVAVHPPAVARADAQHVLDVLQDDARRADLVRTLRTIAAATPAGAPEPSPAPAPAAAPAAAPTLKPDSLGVQLVSTVTRRVELAGEQLAASLQAVNDLPLLWRWVVSQASNPTARAQLADAAWKLAVILLAALAAEYGTRRVLRRLRETLNRWSPYAHEAEVPEPEAVPEAEAEAAADVEVAAPVRAEAAQAAARHGLGRALGALRRLPYLLGRLLLDLLPIGVFFLMANVLLGTRLGDTPSTREAVLLAVIAYSVARVALVLVAFLVSPASPRLRLLHVTDWAANFLTSWSRRLVVLTASGYAVAEIGLVFGMYRTAHDALLKLFALLVHLGGVVAVLQARDKVAARLRAVRQHGMAARLLRRLAEVWHLIAIFYIVALWLVWAIELRDGYARLLHFALATTAVAIVARLLGIVLLGGLERLRTALDDDPARAGLASRAGVYMPVLRTAVIVTLWIALGFGLLQVWGLQPVDWFATGGLGGRVLSAVLVLGATALIAIGVWEAANGAIERHLAALSQSAQVARAGRLRTLLPLLRSVLLITIVTMVALMALSELGVNIAPLLAGAGVLGIAVGFGSQKLVQDLITGLFLLLENAVQVGDVVTVAALSGTVEALSIRTIRLRAMDGSVHIIPFSSVTTVTNQTRDYGYAVLDVAIGLNESPDPTGDVLREVARTMQQDTEWAQMVLGELDVMGVEKLTDLAWIMRVRIKTQPGSRWAVTREMNRRIKVRFDELAIESPFTSHRALQREPPAPPPAPPPAQAEEQPA